MNATQYGEKVTTIIDETAGPNFEYPESFSNDLQACMQQRLWIYADTFVPVGSLIPVSCYLVSRDDHSPATPETCGHIITGFVKVAANNDVPDATYSNGFRRETVVAGPVLNSTAKVVIDDDPIFARR